jgi:hypothetical protein
MTTDTTEARTCPLGDDCDATVAYMAGAHDARNKAEKELAALRAENEKLRLALRKYACPCDAPCEHSHLDDCGWHARAALDAKP